VAVKEARGLKVNYLIIFLSGSVLLISAVLVFLLIVKNIYGNYELREILPTKENLKISADEKREKAAILYSNYTENMLPAGSTWLRDNIDKWKEFIRGSKVNYDIITDQTIELGEHFNYKLIVLPGSKSLSDREIMQLKRYVENGGSVFATGGPATFSDEGKWRGWDFFKEVFGMNFNREIKPEESYKVHTLRGNLPLTAQIPTGYALKVATWDRPIYAEVLEPRTTQVSFWFDFRREAGLVRDEIQKSAGIAYGSYGKGRFVWYGFEISSVVGVQKDYIYFEKLFNNSVNWLIYQPTAFVKDWPAQYNAAMVIVPTIKDQPWNISNLTNLMPSKSPSLTYFMDPHVAVNNPALVKALAQKGDLGAIIDLGYIESPMDTVNKLFSKEVQNAAFKQTNDVFGKLTKKKPKAVMPLFGYYDDNTLQAMASLNYQFLITDSLTDRSVPEVRIRNGKPIMIITKTARDDYEVVRNYGLVNTDYQRYTYEEDIDRVLFESGLYVLKVHTEYQLQPQYAPVISELLKYAESKKIWITSLSELQGWWMRRQGVEVRYETRSKRRIAVEITNPLAEKVTELVIQLNLNKKIKNVIVSSDIINTSIPKFNLSDDQQTIFFFLDQLEAHESRSLLVDFDNFESSIN